MKATDHSHVLHGHRHLPTGKVEGVCQTQQEAKGIINIPSSSIDH